jgi:DUF1680 family protein
MILQFGDGATGGSYDGSWREMKIPSAALAFGAVLACGNLLCGGDLSARFDLTVHRVLEGGPPRLTDDFVVADAVPRHTRRFTEFSGDVSGRYIGAMATASQEGGFSTETLDRIAGKVIALQKPDGHFGDAMSDGKVLNSDMAILWGNGRLLIGLLEYYQVKPRPEVLVAARKLGDFLVRISPLLNSEAVRREYNGEKFAVGYICWTQNVEGLVELYRVTRDERYLLLAKELAARTDRHPSQHSHGFLTTVRGVVELYRATGDRRYLAQAEAEWKGVSESGNVLVQGGVPEMFAPQIKRDEGCSEADWLRLGLELWRETRNPEYLKRAEYTLFNEFSFNQFHTGDFGHHTLTATGIGAPAARAWWCCTFHGLRALVSVFRNVFHEGDGAVYYDLPVDGRIVGKGISLQAESSLGTLGTVRIEVQRSNGEARTIAVRVPEWASGVGVTSEGQQLTGTNHNGYFEVRRGWKSGDAITVSYGMKTRLLPAKKGMPRVAVQHGPWLLAVDEVASPSFFDEPSNQNQVELPESGEVKLKTAQLAGGVSCTLCAPVAHLEVKYLPGGYPMQPLVATLRPIAELTGGPDSSRLELWLPLKPQVEKLDSTYKP